MAVLHVRVVAGSGGGPESTILQSATYLRDSDYQMTAAYMHRPGDPGFRVLQRRAEAHGCPLVPIADRGPFDPRVVGRLLALCRRLHIGIWHGHDYKSNLIGLLLRPLHPMRLVTTAHGWVTHTARTPLYYAVDRWCLRRYDHVVTVSPDLHDAVGALGIAAERRTLICNGVDEQHFQRRIPSSAAPWRERHGIAPSRRVVGAVGRLSSEKGFDHLIRAARALIDTGQDLELVIAGEGPERAQLEVLIDRLNLRQRVRLLGTVEDVSELYEAMDVFVLSSRREGMPNVLLEAMSMRLPVVAAAVGGVPSAIRDGENGILYAPADVEALSAALRRVLADAALRERLGGAARRTIEARFTFATRMAAERAVYGRLGADAI